MCTFCPSVGIISGGPYKCMFKIDKYIVYPIYNYLYGHCVSKQVRDGSNNIINTSYNLYPVERSRNLYTLYGFVFVI